MYSDDSFTDDSFINLYSTQRVTSTYNDLLKKIELSQKASSLNELYSEEKITGSSNGYVDNARATTPPKKQEEEVDEIQVIEDSPGVPEIVEISPVTRRSARIRRRNQRVRLSGQRETRQKRQTSKPAAVDDGKRVEDTEQSTFSDDDVNYEVSVKVIWKSVSVKTFRLRRLQKFLKIYEHFMKEENIPIEKILLSLKNVRISPNDTPESINLQVFDFIEGGTLSDTIQTTNKTKSVEVYTNNNNKGSLTVKVQDVNKKVYKFSVNQNEPLKSVMIRYAEQIEVPLNKIKYYFDGEVINSSDTPDSLGLNDDEIIDVKIIK